MQVYTPSTFPVVHNKKNIHVDLKNYSILLPVEGKMVPFHVACIKNVTTHTERNKILIRFNF